MLRDMLGDRGRPLPILLLSVSLLACESVGSSYPIDHSGVREQTFEASLLKAYPLPVINRQSLRELGIELAKFDNLSDDQGFDSKEMPIKTSFTNGTQKALCIPKKGQYQYFHNTAYSPDKSKMTLGEAITEIPFGRIETKMPNERLVYNRNTRKEVNRYFTLSSRDFFVVRSGQGLTFDLIKYVQHSHDLCTPVNSIAQGHYVLHFMMPAYECDTVLGKRWNIKAEQHYILAGLVDQQFGENDLAKEDIWSSRSLNLLNVPGMLIYSRVELELGPEFQPDEDGCY